MHPSSSLSDASQTLISKKKARSNKKNQEFKQEKFSKTEQDKILKYALKLSLEENFLLQEKKKISLKEIPLAKVFYPNNEEMKNPVAYFETLYEKHGKSTGIIKIVPTEAWKKLNREFYQNEYLEKFKNSQKKLETRKMDLKRLYMAKKFEYVKEYTFGEYKNKCQKFEKEIYGKEWDTLSIDQVEEDYWKICLNESGTNDIIVDYAADVPLSKYFTNIEIEQQMKKHQNENWNLLSLNTQKNSLFQFISEEKDMNISGVTTPWIYFGMLYATFCWHTEDLYLYSLNFMHWGKPKIWYGIPHDQKEKMDKYIKNKYYAILLKEPDLIHFLTVFISPLELIQNGIEVFKAIQNPGELILTLPQGYHTGFSTGFNIAEAVNFATLNWVDFGFKAIEDYKKSKKKGPVFSLEWLIFHNIEKLKNVKFEGDSYRNQFEIYLKKIVTEELSNRKIIELYLNDEKIIFNIDEIDCNLKIEDHECPLCKNYFYLSYMQCNICLGKNCISHLIQCKCMNTNYTLMYRYKSILESLILI